MMKKDDESLLLRSLVHKIQNIPEIKIGKRIFFEGWALRFRLLETFDALGFETRTEQKPVLAHRHKTESGWYFVFHLPPGISTKDVEAKLHHFQEQAGGMISLKTIGNKLHMDICTVDLPKYVPYEQQIIEGMKMPLVIGMSTAGLVIIDLHDIPHLFVAGNTGQGKSATLRTYADMLLANGALLAGIDLKRTEFGYLKSHALIAKSETEALQVLRAVEQEMDWRLDLLEQYDVDSLGDIPERERPPYVALMIDEITELGNEKAQKILNRLARMSRAPGMSLICATQRPSAKTFKDFTETKALFQGRLCFAVSDSVNSRIVLDNDMAAQIPDDIPGRAVWQWSKQQIVQVPFLPRKEAKRLLKQLPPIEVMTVEQHGARLLPR